MSAVTFDHAVAPTRDEPVPPTARTFLAGGAADAVARRPSQLRALGTFSRDDLWNLVGAAASALCTTLLLFGRVTPLRGAVGFMIVAYVLFLGAYALVLSFGEDRPAVADRLVAVLLATASSLAFVALFSVIVYTLWRGREVMFRANFYSQDMGTTGPSQPLSSGGIGHAIVGTLITMTLALALSVPLGIGCAVFLNETRSRFARLVGTLVDAMTALPSILAGLFIFATLILVVGIERCGLAAAVAVSIMMLPIVIRSADVVLRLVPGNLREASAALGAPLWRTVWFVVLPTARPGLATAVILGVARGAGETAPVLLTSGSTALLNFNPLEAPMVSLPLVAFEFVRSSQPAMVARGFASAATLMVLVLGLFVLARVLGGRPAGQVSKRQARRLAARSAKDAERFGRRLEVAA